MVEITSDGQLSFVETARVELGTNPDRRLPTRLARRTTGAFEARLARDSAWSRSERLALAALAERLRKAGPSASWR